MLVCGVVQSLERMMMETREPLEWHFKQLDHSMGLSFKTNFNFAIVGHLLKGLTSVCLSVCLSVCPSVCY